MYLRNLIFGVNPDKERDQTPGKQCVVNTCINLPQMSKNQAFSRNDTTLLQPLGKKHWSACPLNDNQIGVCGEILVTKAKGTKKAPWHWDMVHQKALDMAMTTIAKDIVLAYLDYDQNASSS